MMNLTQRFLFRMSFQLFIIHVCIQEEIFMKELVEEQEALNSFPVSNGILILVTITRISSLMNLHRTHKPFSMDKIYTYRYGQFGRQNKFSDSLFWASCINVIFSALWHLCYHILLGFLFHYFIMFYYIDLLKLSYNC